MDKPHKKLDAWKLGMDVVEKVYGLTAAFPAEEKYGLVDQMRRASVSIPSNLAEGAARQTRREFANFLHMAQGSLSELDTLCELALRLRLLQTNDTADLLATLERVDKMLSGLIRRQRTKDREADSARRTAK